MASHDIAISVLWALPSTEPLTVAVAPIGFALAREEGRIAILNFFKQFPTTRLKAENSFEWIDAMVPRGLKKLDVYLT